jgi:16S rRNA (guanine527-N7)-methyltransferase
VKRNHRAQLEGVDPERIDLLERYEQMLRGPGVSMGLVAVGDRERLWDRHILDSLRGAQCIPSGVAVADLGSGAGLPGIPIAIARPDLTVHLIESRKRRAAFLELATERLGLPNVRVLPSRIEETGLAVQACLARALAPPEASWRLASALLQADGFVLYWAGESSGEAALERLKELGVGMEVCSAPSTVWPGSVVKMARTVREPQQGAG